MTDLSALLSRVENASGPDRELDADIAVAFLPDAYAVERDASFRAEIGTYWYFPPSRARSLHTAERYTASLDAVIALVERVMPGWDRRMSYERSGVDGEFWGWAELLDERDGKRFAAKTKTEPRALLAALIKTKMEEIAQ